MQRYEITGMSCAACAGHVEKAVAAVPGVASVTVSLLTNSMQVDYTPDADPDATAKRILRAVDAAGYGASPATAESESAELEDTETPRLKKRLIASLCFLVPLMYVSMGHMIGLPLGSVFHGGGWHAILYAGTQLALTLPVCWINRAFFISGWKGIRTRAPGMDTLVALGAGASLAYGLFAIVMICLGLSSGNDDLVMQYRHDLYFESAAMILTLITVGKTLEAYSKGKTTDALKSLMKLAPQTACVLRDGEQVTVPVSEVAVGDLFLVRPGESIPVDGTVTEGLSSVNEAALTGESMPVDKFPGSPVSAATINQNGALTCRAERVGQDTTLSQVIRLVRDAAATKAPLAKTADKVSGIFVPTVICIADPLREEAAEVLRQLRGLGIQKAVMMTGDNDRTASVIAKQVGVDAYYAEVLPEDKARFVDAEKAAGRTVIMLGDGINDSPALSAADVGIAISDGAAIAREIADITIAADSLRELVTLKAIANGLQHRTSANYRFIMSFNSTLIVLGAMGILPPATSALLHNASTLGVSLKSMTNLLD